jgi:sulfate permease, SulP family
MCVSINPETRDFSHERFIATTLIIPYVLPRYIKSIPPSVIAIVVLTGIAIFSGIELIIVGDLGAMT